MLDIPLWRRIFIWLVCAAGLLLALPNVFYDRVEQSNDAEAVMATGVSDGDLASQSALWPSFLPDGLVNLGLDLRGGAHLLAEVQVEEVYVSRMDGLWPEVRDVLVAERDTVGFVTREGEASDVLSVRISKPEGMARAVQLVRGLSRPVASALAVGQSDLNVSGQGDLLTVQLSDAEKQATDDRTVQQALEIVRRRIDEVGTREPSIQRQGARRILIQVPGVGSAQDIKDLIGTTAQLTFNPVVGRTEDPNQSPGSGNVILPSLDEPDTYYIIERASVVSGEDLQDAQPSFDQNGQPSVTFRFGPSGARRFGDYTAANVGAPFAIVLDEEVVSAPRINEAIRGGSGQITGNFSVEESTNLAVLLRAGALPAELTFLEERTIGPELGQDSIEAGALACLVAFGAVIVFMALSYGRFGMYANLALVLNVALIFGLLSLIGATLTLPGIAGIVLTIGMAVDANVLVFERIREEMKTAKGPSRAIAQGYEKALSAIIDANITTLITAVILFTMGSGPVRGFAVTLGLGIITSVFTAIFVTRLMIVMWFERRRPKQLPLDRGLRLVPRDTNWQFFSAPKLWLILSGALMIGAVGIEATRGLNYGIDFSGGTTIRTESTQSVDVGTYRTALAPLELGDVSITEVFDPTFGPDKNVTSISIQAQGGEAVSNDTLTQIGEMLQAVDPGLALPFASVESVGPTVSGELIQTAILAVALAIGAVLIYIWLRFEWQFALGAVAALVHDVVLTVGVFSLMQIRFDLAIIAALLTIVGYSLNDTVVVFDRVRENLRRFKSRSLTDVLTLSINETLSRTVMTSVTTLIALVSLWVLGGDVIRGFVFAMIWGVVIGTYSSIFVASAILRLLGVKRDWDKPDAGAGTQFAQVDA